MIYHRKLKLVLLFVFVIFSYAFYDKYYKEQQLDTNSNVENGQSKAVEDKNGNHNSINNHVDLKVNDQEASEYSKGQIKLLNDLVNEATIPDEVVKSINYLNEHHEILNSDTFGGVSAVTRIFAVQVHNRAEYLTLLIDSLKQVKEIEKTLIIFSHDIHFPPVNELIQNIKFCQVIQIFYPYNIQIFHDRFPGVNPNDCDENMSKANAESSKCNNWDSPDTYGHYRSAQLTQIKHHFWWKMNYIYDGVLDRYNISDKDVVLLEEDHMVAPDIFHVKDEIVRVRDLKCPECKMISLGLFMRNYNNYQRDIKKLGKQTWYGKHNTGMVMTKKLWNDFRDCHKLFCQDFDDYNWDWSLIQISYKCFKVKLIAMYSKSPRVLHVGDCGVHTHKCSSQNTANKIKTLFKKVNTDFFPETMELTESLTRVPKQPKPNGGWGDSRDHKLCLLNTYPTNASIWTF